MAFRMRFRRRIRLAPGISLDLNKNSAGLTLGPRGAHVTLNSKGDLTRTVGLPGSGLSWQDRERLGADNADAGNAGAADTGADAEQGSDAGDGQRHCTECGAVMQKSDEFCPKCGTYFGVEP